MAKDWLDILFIVQFYHDFPSTNITFWLILNSCRAIEQEVTEF